MCKVTKVCYNVSSVVVVGVGDRPPFSDLGFVIHALRGFVLLLFVPCARSVQCDYEAAGTLLWNGNSRSGRGERDSAKMIKTPPGQLAGNDRQFYWF
jgi:hypothetical protein